MAQRFTKLYVGMFLAIGLIGGITLAIWLGIHRASQKGTLYVTFFDESVQGLSKDSAVKYRGVPVGRVHDIDVAPDGRLIQVTLSIEKKIELSQETIAQLKPVGITGTMFVELDRISKGETPRFGHLPFPTEYPIIPSRPSEISTIFRGIDELIKDLNSLPLGEIAQNLNMVIAEIRSTISELELDKAGRELTSAISTLNGELSQKPITRIQKELMDTMAAFQGAMREIENTATEYKKSATLLNELISAVGGKTQKILEDVKDTNLELKSTLAEIRTIIKSETLAETISNMEKLTYRTDKTLKKLNALIELFEEQPAGFLLGKEKKNEK